jgi:hypothetical protein
MAIATRKTTVTLLTHKKRGVVIAHAVWLSYRDFKRKMRKKMILFSNLTRPHFLIKSFPLL